MAESAIRGGVRAAVPHDSAAKHVSGEALYVDDLPEPAGMLYAAVGLSAQRTPRSCAWIWTGCARRRAWSRW